MSFFEGKIFVGLISGDLSEKEVGILFYSKERFLSKANLNFCCSKTYTGKAVPSHFLGGGHSYAHFWGICSSTLQCLTFRIQVFIPK